MSIKDSANQLITTATTDWSTSAFGVEIGTVSNSGIGNNFVQAQNLIDALSSQYVYVGQNIVDSFTNGNQYVRVADAAGSAALSYLNEKVQRIKTAWKTPSSVTIGTLWGEVAPFAKNPKAAFKELKNKFGNLNGYLLDTLGFSSDNWADAGKEALTTIINDPSVVSAISSLNAVQAYAGSLNTIATSIDIVKTVVNVLEPLLQIAEITSNTGLLFALGAWGATAGELGGDIASSAEEAAQKVLSIALNLIREFVFNIKIQVPSLLLGALKSVSVKEAVIGWGEGWSDSAKKWMTAVFSQDYYDTVTANLVWKNAIMGHLDDYSTWIEKWASLDFGLPENKNLSEVKEKKFLSEVTKKVMVSAIAEARRRSGLISYGTSARWINLNNASSATSFVVETIPYKEITKRETTASSLTSSDTKVLSNLDIILNDDTEESPLLKNGIVDEESIRITSKMVIDAI